MRSFAAALAVALVLLGAEHAQGHPNAACSPIVSSHGVIVQSDPSEVYSNAKTAGAGKTGVIVFDSDAGGINGLAVKAPSNPAFIGYWEMDAVPQTPSFVVAASAVSNTAQIAANGTTFVVVYVQTGGIIVNSKVVNANLDGVSAELEVGTNLQPTYLTLVGGTSGFYYVQVAGTSLNVYASSAGISWSVLTVSGLTSPVEAPIAATVDASGNVMILYHTSPTDLYAGFLPSGTTTFIALASPTVTGNSVSVASDINVAGVFMIVANNQGDVNSTVSTNYGLSWKAAQVVDSALNVHVNSTVSVVKTTWKWVALWIGKSGANIDNRGTTASQPTSADWLAGSKGSLFSGNTTTGKYYLNPSFSASGGLGWGLATTDSLTNDVSFRACYDPPLTHGPTGSPTRSPTTVSVASNTATGMLFPLLMFACFLWTM